MPYVPFYVVYISALYTVNKGLNKHMYWKLKPVPSQACQCDQEIQTTDHVPVV